MKKIVPSALNGHSLCIIGYLISPTNLTDG